MKKILTAVYILICGIVPAFSLQETWAGTGFEFGNTFEFSDDNDTVYLGAPGFNLSMYTFKENKPFGIFMRGSFLFPAVSGGAENAEDYDLEFEWNLGLAGRLHITEAVKLYGGLGLDCFILSGSYFRKDAASETDYHKRVYNIGIGGDIGIKYDITGYLYLNIGCTLAFLFHNSTSIRSYTESDNVIIEYIRQDTQVKGYTALTVKPYIGIGFNYYSEGKTSLGKPK